MGFPRMNLITKTLIQGALVAALACAGAVYGVRLAGLSGETLFPLWIWPVLLVCGYAAFLFTITGPSREKRAGYVFCLLLIFTQLIGRQFDVINDFSGIPKSGGFLRGLYCFFCAAMLAPALGWPAAALLKTIGKRAAACAAAPVRSRRFFLLVTVVLILLWQPCHLAYYPGLVEYDSGYQLWQSWNHVYSASNPLFHTFILGAFYHLGEQWFGSVSTGIALFCLLQQVFMAACIAWALTIIRRHGAKRWLMTVSVLFFGLFPVFGMLSISLTKDVPFYSLILVQLALVYDGCRREECLRSWRYWLTLTLVTVPACLFRANALAALFLIPPIMCLVCKSRAFRRRLLVFLMGGTALAYGVNALMIHAVNAEKPLLREELNVPIIQLARVSKQYDDVNRDLAENWSDMVDLPMAYIPYVADLSKWNWKVDGNNLGDFLGVWFRWGGVYPNDYMDALLLITKGYWYIGDQTYAKVYGDSYEQHLGVIPSRVTANIDTIREECFLPGFREHLERMYSANEYLNIPVFRLLFCPALYVWMMLFLFVSGICQRRWDTQMVALAGITFLVGLLLGPCCILRYALLFMLLVPVLTGMVLTKPEDKTARQISSVSVR